MHICINKNKQINISIMNTNKNTNNTVLNIVTILTSIFIVGASIQIFTNL